MNKNVRPKHTKRNIVLLFLLALLCIGAAELAACKHFEPELYERIVAPARYAATVAVDTSRAAMNATAQFCREVGDATVQFCRDMGDAAAHILTQTGEKAAALWTQLTTPKEPPAEPDASVAPATDEPAPSVSPTEPPITEMLQVDGRQILTGGSVDVTYFYQAGEDWAEQPYGTDTIGPYGCGPTVMAMAVASMTATDTDPVHMAAWAVAHGYWARRSGSYHAIVIGTARGFGIEAETFRSREADDMRAALREGNMLVALVGPGHFTEGGHFILIRGVTPDGDVLVADPNSPERSLMSWDPQIILDELSSARDSGAPLWLLSMPDT